MSSSLDRAVKDFVQILQESKGKGTSPYDTTATVTRVEDSIAWVHIPGGVEETPVEMTMGVKAGDAVQVRVSGGKAWIAGNATSPPTDDTAANEAGYKALMAEEVAVIAGKKAETAEVVAKRALKISSDTDQYFWHMETGTDTGTHITEIPHDEFIARTEEDPTDGGPNLLARSGGIAIREGLEELAQFSEYIILGKNDGSQSFLYADYHSLQMIDKEGNVYVHFSDLRNAQGEAEFTDVHTVTTEGDFYPSSNEWLIYTDYLFSDVKSITKNSSPFTSYTLDFEGDPHIVIAASLLQEGDVLRIVYVSNSPDLKAFTLGTRDPSSFVAPYSFAFGEDVTASGADSHAEGIFTTASGAATHAEGYNTTASGASSHAEGSYTTASGSYSHAEGHNTTASGNSSHAEGYQTTASGNFSHAEGRNTIASGSYSHAQNFGTIAGYDSQTAIGRHNNNISTSLFEIGNGTSDNARSNAFAVDKNGKVTLYKTGAIAYEGTKATFSMIRFVDNTADANGNGIVIGNSGLTIVGAGEYPTSRMTDGVSGGSEALYLGSDGNVYVETNANTYANKKTFNFLTTGEFNAEGAIFSKTGIFYCNATNLDRSSAPSSRISKSGLIIRDKNSKILAEYFSGISSDGRTEVGFGTRNQNSSGTEISTWFQMFLSKDGVTTYSVPSAANFRSAIGVGTIGTKNSLAASDIPSLDASKITSGTFADARIPSLAASKITSGTFGTDRIPSLAASKITSGTFDDARIPAGILRKNELITQDWNIDNVAIAASGTSGEQTKDVSKSGYTPLMIQVWLTNASTDGKNVSHCFAYYQYLSGNTVKVNVRNKNAADANIKINIKVLYKES